VIFIPRLDEGPSEVQLALSQVVGPLPLFTEASRIGRVCGSPWPVTVTVPLMGIYEIALARSWELLGAVPKITHLGDVPARILWQTRG
jgi:hypothetical protein